MTKGEIEALIAEARERARHPYVWDVELLGQTITRLADALALTRGKEVENSNGLDVASDRISLDDSFASPPDTSSYDRQRERSLACRIALKQAIRFTRDRQAACERERDRYKVEKPDDPYWHMSEQCAAHEARHLAEMLEGQLGDIERQFKRRRVGGPSPSTANVEARHDIPTQPVKTPPDTEHDGGEV